MIHDLQHYQGMEWWQAVALTLAMFALIAGGCFALAGVDLLWQRRQDHYWRHPKKARRLGARRLGILWRAAVDGTHRRVIARTPVVVEPPTVADVQRRHALGWTTEADVVEPDEILDPEAKA